MSKCHEHGFGKYCLDGKEYLSDPAGKYLEKKLIALCESAFCTHSPLKVMHRENWNCPSCGHAIQWLRLTNAELEALLKKITVRKFRRYEHAAKEASA